MPHFATLAIPERFRWPSRGSTRSPAPRREAGLEGCDSTGGPGQDTRLITSNTEPTMRRAPTSSAKDV